MQSSLAWPDYLILAGFLAISLSIGVYHSLTGGRQRTTSEFILADRKLKVLPAAISLCVSFQSAIAYLGFSAELFRYGAQLLYLAPLTVVLSGILLATILLPWLYPLQFVSINEVWKIHVFAYLHEQQTL